MGEAERSVLNSNILIVDDLRENRDQVIAVLTAAGFRTLEASSGSRARSTARAMRPDTILIDIVMPVMPVVNGIELCRSLKSIPELSSIPVLMITAHAAEEN
jgi:CheY-like chemotaxis protein